MITTMSAALDNRGQPARDLRVWGWEEENEQFVRLRIGHPASIWGMTGLRTGDKLVSINGTPVRTWPELRAALTGLAIGDTATVAVERPAGRFEARVVMSGYDTPTVRIEEIPGASERQRRLRQAWLEGR
jgi:predicted metalloprotease with PDZ domain